MTRVVDQDWKRIQEKTLINWLNNRLRGNLRSDAVVTGKVNDLSTDLQDGLLLIKLAEGCARPKKITRYNKKPVLKIQRLENIAAALRFLENEGIKFVNIGPEDIYNGNLKLILGVIWTLIQKYQFKLSNRKVSPKKVMIDWIHALMPEVPVGNFTTDWNSGVALCALVDHIEPGLCPNYESLNPNDGEANCTLGVNLAEKHMEVPKVLDPCDMANPMIDDLSVMTYLSYFCTPYSSKLLKWVQRKLPSVEITNFTTDWNNGLVLAALVDSMSPGLFPDHASLPKARALQNCTTAMNLAEERLGVKKLLQPKELTDPNVDQLSVMSYITQYQTATLQAMAKQCKAVGLPSTAKCGQPVRFKIDATGSGTGKVGVTVTRSGKEIVVDMKEEDNDQIFDVTFTPTEAGVYEIDVTLNNDSIAGMPRDVNVHDSAKCRFPAPIKPNAVIEEPCEFTVDTSKAGPGELEISLTDEETGLALKADVEEEENGVRKASFTPTSVGKIGVKVAWEGDDVAGSPFTISVSDPSKVRAYGEGLLSCKGQAGQKVEFYVATQEAGIARLTVEVTGQGAVYPAEIKQRDDDPTEFEVRFQPFKVGDHQVVIAWGGRPIPSSPFPMQITGMQCDVTGIPQSACVGQEVKFSVDVSGAGDVKVGVVTKTPSGGTNPLTPTESDENRGVYDVSFVPAEPGEYTVEVSLNRQPAPAGPFAVRVSDPKQCAFMSPPPTSIHIDKEQKLKVTSRGAGKGNLVVRIQTVDTKIAVPFEVADSGDGVSTIAFTANAMETLNVDVTWEGRHIPLSPVTVAVCDSSNVVVSGGGLLSGAGKTGQPVEFSVSTKDAGDGKLQVEPKGPSAIYPVEVTPDDTDSSRLNVSFTPWQIGDHEVGVKLGGEPVPNSPFRLDVTGAQCTVTGIPKKALVDQTIEFELDVSGSGDVKVGMVVKSPTEETSIIPLEERIDKPEIYDGVFTPTEAGEYQLVVSLNKEPLASGPYCIRVVDPALCGFMPLPPNAFRVGETQKLTLDGRNAGSGAMAVRVVAESTKKSLPFVVTETEDPGIWDIDFTPTVIDTLNIDVKWSGRHIPLSPLSIPVCDPSKVSVFGPGLLGGQVKIGEPVQLTVDASEAGNLKPEVMAAGPTASQIVTMKENGDGIFTIEFVPWEAGEHRLNVYLGDEEVPGSPFQLEVDRSVDARTVVATGEGLNIAYVDEPAEFDFQTTQSGLLAISAIECIVQGVRSNIDVELEDVGDGKYRARYTPYGAGAFLLIVRVLGVDIPGSPFKVTVYVPADSTKCRIESGVLKSNAGLLVGKPVNFRVSTKEAGMGKLEVIVTNQQGCTVRVFMADDGDGVVSYRFDPDETGRYVVRATWSGQHIPGSPFKVKVWPPPNAGRVKVEGPGLHDCDIGSEGEFTVNAKEAGLGTLLVRVHGIKDAFKISLTPGIGGDPRIVRAMYSPTEPGDYVIIIKWEGVEVPGSPFEVTITDPDEDGEFAIKVPSKQRRRRTSCDYDDYDDEVQTEEDTAMYNPSEPDLFATDQQYTARHPRRPSSPRGKPAESAPMKRPPSGDKKKRLSLGDRRQDDRQHRRSTSQPARSGMRKASSPDTFYPPPTRALTPDPRPPPGKEKKKMKKMKRATTEPIPVQNWSFAGPVPVQENVPGKKSGKKHQQQQPPPGGMPYQFYLPQSATGAAREPPENAKKKKKQKDSKAKKR